MKDDNIRARPSRAAYAAAAPPGIARLRGAGEGFYAPNATARVMAAAIPAGFEAAGWIERFVLDEEFVKTGEPLPRTRNQQDSLLAHRNGILHAIDGKDFREFPHRTDPPPRTRSGVNVQGQFAQRVFGERRPRTARAEALHAVNCVKLPRMPAAFEAGVQRMASRNQVDRPSAVRSDASAYLRVRPSRGSWEAPCPDWRRGSRIRSGRPQSTLFRHRAIGPVDGRLVFPEMAHAGFSPYVHNSNSSLSRRRTGASCS